MASTPSSVNTASKVIKTAFTYRLRPPIGLEHTLVKEIKLLGFDNARKIPGRKTVEVIGPESTLWDMMFKSRIAEDIQV